MMTGSASERTQRSGMSAVLGSEEFSVSDTVGGPRGVVESVLPTALFVILFVATSSIPLAGGAAVGVVVLALLVRLVQRQSPSTVLGGLIGVAVGAVWALRSGNGSDFYSMGIIINAVSLTVLLLTIALRRPLVGVLIGLLDPRVAEWGQEPTARRTYTRATWLFAGLYAAKLLVQVPLWLADQVAALGVAKLVMGLPLFALVTWIVWLMHRTVLARQDAARAAVEESGGDTGAPAGPRPEAEPN